MAEWKSFEIQVPGKDLLEPVREVLETLLIFLDVLKAILDTIKTFLIDFGNPIRALVEALIQLIEELFLSLKVSGIFAYFDVPNPLEDPNFAQNLGGYQSFVERFKASLFDSKDFNRPQPRTGSTQSGFVLIMVDASSPYALISRIKQLLRFFGKEFTSPQYAAPENVRAIPVGEDGDPILAVAEVFSKGPIQAIQLQWTLPTTVETPDPGFSDVVTRMAAEFIPASYLIERSTVNPAVQKIDIADLGAADAVGLVEYDQETVFELRPGERTTTRSVLYDEQGEPVIKFQKYTLISGTDVTNLLGQLGRFRYIDSDVEFDKTYYYRVRAFSGTLTTSGNQINFPTTVEQLKYTPGVDDRVMRWRGPSGEDAPVMGKPSGIVSATIPKDLGDFDVIETLKRLFQAAFSLDFHLAYDEGSVEFDSNGLPISGTSPSQVGRNSLTNLAGPLAAFQSFPIVNMLASGETVNESFSPDPITGEPPQMPWQSYAVRKQSARLADIVTSAMLEAGSDAPTGFRDIMRGSYPRGIPDVPSVINVLGVNSTLEGLVYLLTKVDAEGNVDTDSAVRYEDSYSNALVRANILVAIQYLKSFTLGGVPPNWISVVPLRDIIPWSGQMIYDLLDKIQALLDAFSGVMDEIRNFIALLERKIDALERFLQFLLDILNFIESLQVGAYVLSVPSTSGTVHDWANIVDSAGGTKPPLNAGGYSAGVALAYVAPDISAFQTAFGIIFG